MPHKKVLVVEADAGVPQMAPSGAGLLRGHTDGEGVAELEVVDSVVELEAVDSVVDVVDAGGVTVELSMQSKQLMSHPW